MLSAIFLIFGRGLLTARSLTLAEKYYRRAVQKNPNSYSGWLELGYVHDQQKKFQEAVKDYVRWKTYEKPGRYFNFDLARSYKKDYMRSRNELKIEVAKDGEELEAKPVSFVTGNSPQPIGFSLNE
ncbi:hypothetical protein LCGC14_3152430 [marine sediment metagenome]|uniref:Uncharacterized protein n=1 Tax=marine sediment metagenome TaxID=412755 RepID=A0A0F8Y0F9_9ZZZZ